MSTDKWSPLSPDKWSPLSPEELRKLQGPIHVGRYRPADGTSGFSNWPWMLLALRHNAVCVINMPEDEARELMLALQEWFANETHS